MRCGACHVEFDPITKDYIHIRQYSGTLPEPADEVVCTWDCAEFIVKREQDAEGRR